MTWPERQSPAPSGKGGRAGELKLKGEFGSPENRPAAVEAQARQDRLIAEWRVHPGNNQRTMGRLAELGISIEAQIRAGDVWIQKVTTMGRIYSPDPCGRPLVLMPIWSGAGNSIYGAEAEPWLNDLLAFDGDEPFEWWLRTGTGGVLGEYALEVALDTGAPITLHPHPLAWLQSNCAGAVVLGELEWLYGLPWDRAA